MFRINEVLQLEGHMYRVLLVLERDIVWINIDDASSFPDWVAVDALNELIDQEKLTRAEDPFEDLMYLSAEQGTTNQLKRDANYELIRPLIEADEFYDKRKRARIIKQIMQEKGSTKQTLYRLARRYWQRGQTPNALLPDYKNSGAPGKRRLAKDKKLGRPRKYAPGVGALIDESVERLFRIAIDKYVLVDTGFSFLYAHRRFKSLYETYYPDVGEQEMPSRWQMKHFYEREYGQLEQVRKRTTDIIFNKDTRQLPSTVNTHLMGPASQFEIDATIADIYLVSDSDRGDIVGRPVLYLVVDSFSRAIVGFYIGFENPSYVAAMQALSMALSNKVEYCHALGFDWVTKEHWPDIGLCDTILADKGELLGHQIESLEKGFHVTISNTASYRSEAKGIVERDFRSIQADFSPFAPGVVKGTKIKKRGGKDYRLDAKLSVRDFKEIILSSILVHNLSNEIDGFSREPDMPLDVDCVPMQMWSWGIQARTGKPRSASEEAIRVGLMPRTEASFSNLGVCVWGAYYIAPEVMEEGWMLRKKGIKRPDKMEVAYDPATAEFIYLFPVANKRQYITCRLHDRSREYHGMSFWEVWRYQDEAKGKKASSKLKADKEQRKHEDFVEQKIKSAIKKAPNTSDESNASRIASINQNRSRERDKERKANAYRPETMEPGKTADVVPIAPPADDDCSYPDFVDELFDDEDN